MRFFILLSVFTTLILSSSDCSNKNTKGEKYKGKLEIAGICMNYTIKLLEGNMDSSRFDANWIDETTGKSHTRVFKLGNICNFPATIKEGDEFNFIIDSTENKKCAICMAYYPTPSKTVPIKVVE